MSDLPLFDAAPDPTVVARTLLDDYLVPPFTVLDTRQGYWQDRKREWLALGIKSEAGRDAALTYGRFVNFDGWEEGATSIFDPVLCELAYRWFAPKGGTVLDPFAGGSVRGIVAASLGHPYYGIELRPEQVASNRQQGADIIRPEMDVPAPVWIEGDADDVLSPEWGAADRVPDAVDLVFTCPPYADLEVYSDHPADLSNMEASEFDRAYARILAKAVDRLRADRFAVIVIGNTRYKNGALRDLVGLTVDAMEDAGAAYYNEAVLLTSVGTGAVRARKQMETSRKLVRLHQQVLVFVKGNPRAATAAIEGAS